MDALLTTSAFRLYAIASTAIALHLVLLALWTGTVRAVHKKFINEEDARLNKGTLVPVDIEPVQRVKRAHMNGLENALPFLAIGFFYSLTSPSDAMASFLLLGFAAMRVAHSLVYMFGQQPYRTLSFAAGVLALFVMSVQVLRAAL